MEPCAKICEAAALKNKKVSKKGLNTSVLACGKDSEFDECSVIGNR
jgi:hypothetical protein